MAIIDEKTKGLLKPTIEVLGAYRLAITESLIQEQTDILYGSDISKAERIQAEKICKEQLESAVLIEALVNNVDERFDAGDFGQADSEQAAYEETYLTVDGNKVISQYQKPADFNFRIAFFIHYFDHSKKLKSSYGPLECPPVKAMPDRLSKLVPYEPVD
ncbi:MAG TPA: hypothetical protein VM658_21890 [bacterium]|nr:hypothetical protein [bacterium]